jgi:chromosome partitioning protein
VVGNQKGGVGKSTTALHIIVTLLRQGRQVASVDLDAHQWSLSRYFSNRTASTAKAGIKLPLPEHWRIWPSLADSRQAAEIEERTYFQQLLDDLSRRCEFIVMDCAGGDQYLSRLAHSHADTLVTPLNDSFIDFDLLARLKRQQKQGQSRSKPAHHPTKAT